MFHLPEHYHNLSLRLSEVLDDIGVNERMVKKRRRSALLVETSESLLSGRSNNVFGSRSEGTTTVGLHSDVDILISRPDYNVIQDYAEWKPGLINFLMIKDEETSPGYCQLQLIRPDRPLPITDVLDKHCIRDAYGRILLKNTAFEDLFLKTTTFDDIHPRSFKNGPARSVEGLNGAFSQDTVIAMSCESWPTEARDFSQGNLGKWPTEDMKRYVENSGCFVVPVGSKVSQIEHLEWRMSTSKAERCYMFNLNITQIRCLVLLKMILKSYLPPISSYMCKTVLLRCIEKTHYNLWQEKNLLTCLTVCLQALYSSVLHESCPHYFIPGINLMAREFSPRIKDMLLKSLHYLLNDQGAALYGIHIDALGQRLAIKMNLLHQSVQSAHLLSANDIRLRISRETITNVAHKLCDSWAHYILLKGDNHIRSPITLYEELMHAVLNVFKVYKDGTNAERKVLQLVITFICSSLGSVLASSNIGTNHSISLEAFNWLSVGLGANVSSGRLKLASVLYCSGDMLRAESILRETERFFVHLDSVRPICTCNVVPSRKVKWEYSRICDIQNEKAISIACAFCVKFFSAEMNCIPYELQFELFRSTSEEQLHRHNGDSWMEMAVVDSLPFLYFLQYKTYGNLQNRIDQQIALENLASTIYSDEDFGHRETALNLLGQCMEQENRLDDALVCYTSSLNVRGRNNAARLHLCILLADMQKNI